MNKSTFSSQVLTLKRFFLHVKAEFMTLVSPGKKAENAWFDVICLEAKTLSSRDPSRAHAHIELARCYIERPVPALNEAEGELRYASRIIFNNSNYDFHAARADYLRGRIKSMQGDIKWSLSFHERAERLYVASNSYSMDRSENLDELAKCYRLVGRLSDAEDASLKSFNIRSCMSYMLPRYP